MKMHTTITKTKWIYLPVLFTSVLGFGCRDNNRISQPTASVPDSTASMAAPSAPYATTTPSASTTTPSADRTTPSADRTTAASMPSATAAAPANLNDMQIADVVKAVNDAEIGAGTLAKTRAENPQVRAYATKMIDEHNKNNLTAKSIMTKKSDAATAENEVSKAMRADTASRLSKLQNMSGSAFDQAYIDEQVKMHKQLLSDLDNNYIPAAKDAKLKDYLKETRKHVSQHLQGAQQVLTMINSGS